MTSWPKAKTYLKHRNSFTKALKKWIKGVVSLSEKRIKGVVSLSEKN